MEDYPGRSERLAIVDREAIRKVEDSSPGRGKVIIIIDGHKVVDYEYVIQSHKNGQTKRLEKIT